MPAITATEVIDRELRARGTTLDSWSKARGIHLLDVAAVLEGLRRTGTECVLYELAEELGVSADALSGLAREYSIPSCQSVSY